MADPLGIAPDSYMTYLEWHKDIHVLMSGLAPTNVPVFLIIQLSDPVAVLVARGETNEGLHGRLQ